MKFFLDCEKDSQIRTHWDSCTIVLLTLTLLFHFLLLQPVCRSHSVSVCFFPLQEWQGHETLPKINMNVIGSEITWNWTKHMTHLLINQKERWDGRHVINKTNTAMFIVRGQRLRAAAIMHKKSTSFLSPWNRLKIIWLWLKRNISFISFQIWQGCNCQPTNASYLQKKIIVLEMGALHSIFLQCSGDKLTNHGWWSSKGTK